MLWRDQVDVLLPYGNILLIHQELVSAILPLRNTKPKKGRWQLIHDMDIGCCSQLSRIGSEGNQAAAFVAVAHAQLHVGGSAGELLRESSLAEWHSMAKCPQMPSESSRASAHAVVERVCGLDFSYRSNS